MLNLIMEEEMKDQELSEALEQSLSTNKALHKIIGDLFEERRTLKAQRDKAIEIEQHTRCELNRVKALHSQRSPKHQDLLNGLLIPKAEALDSIDSQTLPSIISMQESIHLRIIANLTACIEDTAKLTSLYRLTPWCQDIGTRPDFTTLAEVLQYAVDILTPPKPRKSLRERFMDWWQSPYNAVEENKPHNPKYSSTYEG